MPWYEYRCEGNGRTLEVRHGMNERLRTWGEVVTRTGGGLDGTPADAPVERLMSAPVPVSSSGPQAASQGCGAGCACAQRA